MQIPLPNKYRPQTLDDFVGHADLIKKIRIALDASKKTGNIFPSTLISAPSGTGKSSISYIIAKELSSTPKMVTATGIESLSDLISIFINLPKKSVVFLDEIHCLAKGKLEEHLYTILEDNTISIKTKAGNKEKITSIPINPVTIIGATTKVGKLSQALVGRFGICHQLGFYSDNEIYSILSNNIDKVSGISIGDKGILSYIADRSRGIPRLALRLMDRCADYCISQNQGVFDKNSIEKAMEIEGIDQNGLSEQDRKYLNVLVHQFGCGPAGSSAISSSMNEDVSNISDIIEPFLLRNGFISRTTRGRVASEKGIEAIGGHLHLE